MLHKMPLVAEQGGPPTDREKSISRDFPVQIVFRDTEPAPELRAHVRRGARRLGFYGSRMISCHVVIERLASEGGGAFHVRVCIYLPGDEAITEQASCDDPDAYHAIREAFDRVYRRLREMRRRMAPPRRCRSSALR